MKRMLCLLLCLLCLTSSALAGGEQYEYRLSKAGSAIITSVTGEDASLTIPDTLDDHKVIGVDQYALYCHLNLKTVRISDGVTGLGNHAFAGCEQMKSIILPDTLRSIGSCCFEGCTSLREITLPASLEKISGNPFVGCNHLEHIHVESGNTAFTIMDNALVRKSDMCLIAYPAGLAVKDVQLAEGITQIAPQAINGRNIRTVTLPSTLVKISAQAFSGCEKLESIEIPTSVTEIGDSAFLNCWALTRVVIPKTVKTIGENAFTNCKNVVLVVEENSYAYRYAKKYHLSWEIAEPEEKQ